MQTKKFYQKKIKKDLYLQDQIYLIKDYIMSQNEVEVIIILGPHRSGTSLFAKFVSCYGYEFTENLIPKNKYNQKGYFEDKDIIDFNEKLLKSVNFTWNKNQFIDNKLQNSKIITDVNLDLAKKLIRNKLFQNNKIILKDPRFSILINFWKKVFSEIQVRTKYICLLRNPIEVSLSMLRRDTTSITYGLCLWSIYILEIIKNCNYNNFLFISLNTFQNNPEKTKEILNKYLSKKLEKDEFEKYLSDFYSKDLFSTRLNENILENEILINKEFRNIYQSLLSLVDDYNEDNLFKVKQKLDEVRNNLDLNKNFELLDWEYEKILSDNKTNDGKYNEKIKQFEIEKSKSLRIIQNADKSIKEESRILTTQQKRIERDHEELKNKLTEFEDYKS
ncbi:MAG: hypothetical protein CMG07_00685, partial [Candidatus Marinimicrobia bacterium]|nr:hypothetical protein [Candidatus Neomarinimicrobiota bacterium]